MPLSGAARGPLYIAREEPRRIIIESRPDSASAPDSVGPSPSGRRAPIWVAAAAVVAILVAFAAGRQLFGPGDVVPFKEIARRPLPLPALSDVSLGYALQNRASHREFSPRPLDSQTLSNVLWSAYGINRDSSGRRTAPTAYDWRYMDIYILDAHGIGLYDAVGKAVVALDSTDVRALAGVQDFVATAPLTIVLVSDESRMDAKESHGMQPIFSGVAAGAIAQNVYLYCASAGLNAVVRASMDRVRLHGALRLGRDQKIVVAQTIGYPPDSTTR